MLKNSVAKAATKVARTFTDDATEAADMNKGKYGIDMTGKDFKFCKF